MLNIPRSCHPWGARTMNRAVSQPYGAVLLFAVSCIGHGSVEYVVSDKPLGASCSDGDVCASRICYGERCSSCMDDTTCLPGSTCHFDEAATYYVCASVEKRTLGETCVDKEECHSGYCLMGVCSMCEDASTCGEHRDCMFDSAMGYGACRGALAPGASCTDGGECLSSMCTGSRCSLCGDDDDCFNQTHCTYKEPEGYALCIDPNEERVNADFSPDGSFERVGCNDNCNGCVCDANADGVADGYCVGHECAVPSWSTPMVLDCDLDACSTGDSNRQAFTTCEGHSGLTCRTMLGVDASFYEQEGLCTCFEGGMCQCQAASSMGGGDVLCLNDGTVYHQSQPACQTEGTPCDDTYIGNFDPGYGTISGGSCQAAACSEPRVDIERNGTFSWCGCDSIVQGLLCHPDSDQGVYGLCAVDECVLMPPVARDCFRDNCNGTVVRGCQRGGQACDATFLRNGQQEFVHEGFCADTEGTLDCVTTGHVCRTQDGSFHRGCSACANADPCDATLTDGAFDSSYGACHDGVCMANEVLASFDWRNHAGGNWTTPAANQQHIGACMAFAALSAIEARWNIQNDNPDLDINLAEQDLVSCGGMGLALGYVESTGVPDEVCFPWRDDESVSCDERCSDVDSRRWTISGFSRVENYRNVPKLTIQNVGPVVASMSAGGMAKDASGVYSCPSLTGGHDVVVVGWNDTEGYWIVKNSWGATWNPSELGFFRLRYGACNLAFEYSIDSVLAP